MTTSSTNNSVFRGIFEKQKLTGPNFINWYQQLRIVLSVEDKLNYLKQPIPSVPVAPAGQQVAPEILATHSAWVKGSKEIAGLMLMTMEPKIQRNLEPLHAHEMLKEQEEGQSVSSYILKMKGYIENLERLGNPVTLGLGVSLILIGLRKEYNGFMHNYNMHSTGKTVNELHAMLKLHEQTLPKSNASALNAIRAGKGLRASRKLKPGDLSLYVDNGQREAVEAIGAFYLCLPSGLEIVLNNCHCAPFITRAVISVSHLYEDGFVNRFVDNAIQVSRNNVVYFCAIPRDDVCGPFKIMSRQGASNFITFTDDFSRYGYVYLLKHKHEVFETFKVLQKEVENQLGKTIKLLRSNRGGEYMSQEFLDHLKDHGIIAHRTPPYTPQHNENSLIDQEASGRLEDLEIIQEEDTHPSLNTSLNHEEEDLEIDEPQSDIVPIRSKWLFKKKTDMDGNVHIYKARLMAKGYTQTPGIDYEETFSPIADIRAIRILIAIVAYYDYEIWQMDVKTAFLNEEVYMEQPEGFVNPKYLNRNVPYASAVGSIMCAVRCTRPDIAFAQNITSRFQQNPGDIHWTTIKNILKYLRNTKDVFLVYGEAKYIAAFDASKKAVWVRKFIFRLSVVPIIEEPISMYCDNTGAIAIANESGITKGARHFRAKVHYLREEELVVELQNYNTSRVARANVTKLKRLQTTRSA
nr:zinc finger, CCHC-type [Tanacetum cinerariifolium]